MESKDLLYQITNAIPFPPVPTESHLRTEGGAGRALKAVFETSGSLGAEGSTQQSHSRANHRREAGPSPGPAVWCHTELAPPSGGDRGREITTERVGNLPVGRQLAPHPEKQK